MADAAILPILPGMRHVAKTRDEAEALLRAHGIHVTRQRIDIVLVLFARAGHFSADQVLEAINQGAADTSKATVYNNLKVLVEKGLVREVIADPSRVFYDSNTDPHHHVYNVDSGELTDIDAGIVEVKGLPALPEGIVAEGLDVIVRVRARGPA